MEVTAQQVIDQLLQELSNKTLEVASLRALVASIQNQTDEGGEIDDRKSRPVGKDHGATETEGSCGPSDSPENSINASRKK